MDIFVKEPFTDYLADNIDRKGRRFLSSSELTNIIDQTLYRKETDALSFGRKAHELVEGLIMSKEVDIYSKKEYEQEEVSPWDIVDTPSNIKKLKNIKKLVTQYIKDNSIGREMTPLVERSVYLEVYEFDHEKVDECLLPLHNFLTALGRPIKIRFDYLKRNINNTCSWLYDWKTFTETSLTKVLRDIHYRHYILRMCLYSYVLQHKIEGMKNFSLVMIPKQESGGRIIDVTVDFAIDSDKIYAYLESVLADDLDEKVKLNKLIKGNQKTLYLDYWGKHDVR